MRDNIHDKAQLLGSSEKIIKNNNNINTMYFLNLNLTLGRLNHKYNKEIFLKIRYSEDILKFSKQQQQQQPPPNPAISWTHNTPIIK